MPDALPEKIVPKEDFVRREFFNPWPDDINWSIVYHRIEYGRANNKPCRCIACQDYLAYIEAKYYPA